MNAIKCSTAAKAAAFMAAVACVIQSGFWLIWAAVAPELTEEYAAYMRDTFGTGTDLRAAYIRGGLFFVCTAVLVVFLMSASGHHEGKDRVEPGWAGRVPFDVIAALTAAVVAASLFIIIAVGEEMTYMNRPDLLFLAIACGGVLSVSAVLGMLMSFAARVKLGGWYRNTVCFMVLHLAWRLLRAVLTQFARGIRALVRGVRGMIGAIPTVWKGLAVLLAIWAVEFTVCALASPYLDVMFIWWLLLHLALLPLAVYALYSMRRLEKAGEMLAAGDLSYHVNTSKMFGSFRKHGENLNSLGSGMNLAVEERLKSERFKTELITNVSHDIKTPLTSIINYSELLSRGEDPEKTAEYAGVLKRQSEKLKRLLEDLVEASKASTGNLDVILAPCDAGVFVSQIEGEYAERTADAGLELVCEAPERPVRIMADGRRMQRIFDNLMNNAIKYSQPGTRIYVDLAQEGVNAVFSFRNTSRARLNISADELMERFVRGDEARTTEGSGLGLSIARSLTELQGGTLRLSVDGDLFKAVLSFPEVSK